jgi:S-adenosylmethionine-diacylgycerolhomoserine-N-methlytransferase
MEHLERYYRFQSTIYDATRWLFLFGRGSILKEIRARLTGATEIVEIGCGTGRNLAHLARIFPEARITGIDLSPEMLAIAARRTARLGRRVTLCRQIQRGPLERRPDAVLFSYSLSMMNPGWDEVLAAAVASLGPSGILAVVDFHQTPVGWFRVHMGNHHVRMEAHLLPLLSSLLDQERLVIRRAYGGLWSYILFVGRKASPAASAGERP